MLDGREPYDVYISGDGSSDADELVGNINTALESVSLLAKTSRDCGCVDTEDDADPTNLGQLLVADHTSDDRLTISTLGDGVAQVLAITTLRLTAENASGEWGTIAK